MQTIKCDHCGRERYNNEMMEVCGRTVCKDHDLTLDDMRQIHRREVAKYATSAWTAEIRHALMGWPTRLMLCA